MPKVRNSRREERQPGDDYTVAEACRALRMGRTKLKEYIAAKPRPKIGHQKYGKHVTFTEVQLAEFRLLNEKGISEEERRRLVQTILRHMDSLAEVLNEQQRRIA
jgi:hypothetical protein